MEGWGGKDLRRLGNVSVGLEEKEVSNDRPTSYENGQRPWQTQSIRYYITEKALYASDAEASPATFPL